MGARDVSPAAIRHMEIRTWTCLFRVLLPGGVYVIGVLLMDYRVFARFNWAAVRMGFCLGNEVGMD